MAIRMPQLMPSRLLRAARRRARRLSDHSLFAAVMAFTLGGTLWSFLDYSHNVRIAGVAIMAMVFGSLVLNTVYMITLVVVIVGCVLVVVVPHEQVTNQLTASGVVMLTSVAAVSIIQASRRDALGLRRTSAETVLERVRHRLGVQGQVPALPLGWHVDVAQRTANRAAFAGDFVLTRVHDVEGVPHLEVALVDVSGSGIEAGSRALLLSGAVGGLLGAVPADDFLDQANGYLRRQNWGADFAAASHVRLNLATSQYEIRNAGNPPPLRWAGADRAAVRTTSSGTVLGVVDQLTLRAEAGTLEPGDALVLYTDGLIEQRPTDLDADISRLEREVGDTVGQARTVPDDRTVVVVWKGGRGARPDQAESEVRTIPGRVLRLRRRSPAGR
jgi:serine phosphatase RsbU (regulator of sigma subunit)